MIECPLCHVANDDRSLFCAECGQRFAPLAGQVPTKPEPPIKLSNSNEVRLPENSRSGSLKLHSPILDGAVHERSADQLVPPTHAPQPPIDEPSGLAGVKHANHNAKKGLRSPLLGGYEEELEEESPPSTGGFPHRTSSLLSTPPSFATPSAGSKIAKHLRSPLLGNPEEPPEDEPRVEKASQSKSPSGSKIRRLRSPMLGGSDDEAAEDFDPPAPPSDPNALRSPLLAARLPQSDKSTTGHALSNQTLTPPAAFQPANFGTLSAPHSSLNHLGPGSNPNLISNQPIERQSAEGSIQLPRATNELIPEPNLSSLSSPTPVDPASALTPSPSSGQNTSSPKVHDQGLGEINPTSAPLAQSVSAAHLSGSKARSSQSVSRSESSRSSIGNDFELEDDRDFDTEFGDQRGERVSRYGEALPTSTLRRPVRSRLLPGESPMERRELTQPRKFAVVGKIMLVPLFFAVCFKVWFLISLEEKAIQSMPVLGDQMSQLVVLVCIMIFTYLVSTELG